MNRSLVLSRVLAAPLLTGCIGASDEKAKALAMATARCGAKNKASKSMWSK